MSIDSPPNSQSAQQGWEIPLPGVTDDWFGSLDSFCALIGVGGDVRKALEKSLVADEQFLNLSQRQQFLSAATGIRHLAKLAEGKRNGLALSRRKARGKGR